MSISNLLTAIWSALRGTTGGGQDFVVVYTALGAVLWGFLLFKVFLQEGLQVATGHHSELARILVKYLFIAGMFAIWPEASVTVPVSVWEPFATVAVFHDTCGDAPVEIVVPSTAIR